MRSSICSALALSTCLLFGWTASALADDGVVSKSVKFEDLDISKAEGAQALYRRISAAANAVCRMEPYMLVRSCRNRAVDDAVQGVGSALLSSIHRSAVESVEEVVLR